MKNLKLFMMSFIVLTFISCSEENIQNKNETVLTKNIAATNKKATLDGCSFSKIIVGPADNLYNCFGLAFYLSEKGDKVFVQINMI